MNDKGKIVESEAKKILCDLLNGFSELVKDNIIHRDLKPENILINDGVFKLCDFGFGKLVEGNFGQQMLQTQVGTPLYMSPQILMNKPYTTKSDVWSLGLIYFEMLFGKTPWLAQTQNGLLKNIKNKPL